MAAILIVIDILILIETVLMLVVALPLTALGWGIILEGQFPYEQ